MFSRPSDNGHTPFGDIYYSESPDMVHWGYHRWVLGPGILVLHQGRRRPHPDRDHRRLAADLPRRADLLQWLCLLDERCPARSRPALEGHLPRRALSAFTPDALRMCW